MSKEFSSTPPPDFHDNASWFNVKLYTDGSIEKSTNGVDARGYATVMGRVAKALCCSSSHTSHLGRILGPKKLELLELDSEEIRTLGNWDPKQQETAYSTKVPMKVLRAMVGFEKEKGGGMHYNPRSAVPVPDVLTHAVFPWLDGSLQRLIEYETVNKKAKPTARQFLKHLILMRKVVIQDAAAMNLIPRMM